MMSWPKLNPRARRLLPRFLGGFVIIYIVFATFILWAMHQPPEVFGEVMAKMPGPVPFLLFPFETAWTHARAGSLRIGDPAPDFSLLKLDRSARVRLWEFTAQRKPVVLVFGSYT